MLILVQQVEVETMTITNIDIGGREYESYASLSQANDRLAVDLTRMATWNSLSDDDKNVHLVAATNRLDLLNYKGKKKSVNQTNQWPREGIIINDTPVTETDVPIGIENACILLAGSISADASHASPQPSTGRGSIRSVRSGDEQITYAGEGETISTIHTDIATTLLQDPEVIQLIKPYLAVSNPPVTNRKVPGSRTGDVSGTSDSSFTDKVFGVTEGY